MNETVATRAQGPPPPRQGRTRWPSSWFDVLAGATSAMCFTAAALGCGNAGPSVGSVQPSPAFDSIFIVVENQNFYDAAVYLQFQGGAQRRLATVQAYTTERFAVRYDPSEMLFQVDFVGARFATRTRPMSLSPGETVQLELTANAHRTGQLVTRRRR